jgi:two-component system, NtrC family, sensor kinase
VGVFFHFIHAMIYAMTARTERILLVLQEKALSDLLFRQILQPLGYDLQLVENAPAAIKEAARFSPDVIITNLSLPGLSGKDLLVALSSQRVIAPVIVLAQRGMEADVIQAFRLGASDYIALPLREAEVVSVLNRVFQQVRERRERAQMDRKLNLVNQELQRRVRELTTLLNLSKAVITTTDPEVLFERVVEGAIYITEADLGWLLLHKEEGKSFALAAYRNLPADIIVRRYQPWEDILSSLVAVSGEALSIHGEPIKRFMIAKYGQSALVMPIKGQERIQGLLVVMRKEATPFNKTNQALLEAVADYASIAMVNANLFQTLREKPGCHGAAREMLSA